MAVGRPVPLVCRGIPPDVMSCRRCHKPSDATLTEGEKDGGMPPAHPRLNNKIRVNCQIILKIWLIYAL